MRVMYSLPDRSETAAIGIAFPTFPGLPEYKDTIFCRIEFQSH